MAFVFIVLLSPVMAVVAILVKLTSQGPILFWSSRVGRNGMMFRMPKFRTMTTCSKIMAREIASNEDCKMTPIGRFLRRSSLDELPQLWSILKGDMSFIGPRPLLPCDTVSILRTQYREITSIRPGLTGLAQVNGRNFVTPRNKARYDAFYARRACGILDAKIILATFRILHRVDFVK